MSKHLPVYDGDSLLLYCTESSGYLYSEPRSKNFAPSNILTVYTSQESKPIFPNVEFAAFNITHGKLPTEIFAGQTSKSSLLEGNDSKFSDPMTIVYGSTIKLQHKASGKFLSITPSTPGCLDNADSQYSVFRLVSPRQEKGWGEDLALHDCIKFESVYHKGYRIQCVYNAKEASYHLVLAVTGSVFSVKSHCHKQAIVNPQSIRGGTVVMLSSLKIDGYLSSKSSFANDKLLEQFRQCKQTLGLRRWRKSYFKVLPFSGDTYFQFEKVSDDFTGVPFLFGDKCRIKHLPTQQFVSVSKTLNGLEITLKSFPITHGSEIFEILSANKTEKLTQVIDFGQVVLRHVNTQKLLSVNVKPVQQTNYSSQQDPLSQWFHLTLDESKEHTTTPNCIFEVTKVEDDAIVDVYDVTCITSSLCSQLKKFSLFSSNTDHRIFPLLTNVFIEVNLLMKGLESLFDNSHNGKRLANMLRTFQGIDAMVSVLIQSSMQSDYVEGKRQCCNSICSALQMYTFIGNKKSRRYLAKIEIMNSLLNLVGKGIGTEKVLIALYEDDVEIRDQMQDFISSLIGKFDTEDPEVAELMTTLAFNGRRFNRDIQNQIYEKTLQSGMVHNHHASDEVRLILDGFVRKSIGQYLEKNGIATSRQPYTYNYIDLSINQIVELNFGVNQLALITNMEQNIHQYLTLNEMHVLYFAEEFKGRNSIIAQVLGVLIYLIDYGVYSINGTKALQIINNLIKILDTTTDIHSSGCDKDKFKNGNFPGSQIIFKIKMIALQCLQLFFKRHCHVSLEKLLLDFKVMRGSGDEFYLSKVLEESEVIESDDEDDSTREKPEGLRMQQLKRTESIHETNGNEEEEEEPAIQLDEIAIQTEEGNNTVYPVYVPPPPAMKYLLDESEDITEAETKVYQTRLRDNFRNAFYEVFDVDSTNCQQLCNILVELINFEDTEICLMSAELLYDMYSVETILLSDAQRVYFLSPYSNESDLAYMKQVATMTDEDQLLSKMLKRKIDGDNVPKLLNTLNQFSVLCVLSEDETEPNSCNQGVAYSCGLFNIVLEYVLEYGNSDYFDQEEILRSCFSLLQSIARKNPIAQKKLFANFHDFLDVKIAVAPMVYLLNEIFLNNSSICKCLSETDIKQMFYSAIASSNQEHFELFITLRTIIQAIQPSTPMQEYVMQLFMDMWEDNLSHIYKTENKDCQINLLVYADDEKPDLNLLLNTSDLLSTCAEGECQFAESAIARFFSIDDLLEILCNDNIGLIHRKLPFARVLTWTYLNTERDSMTACSQLASSSNFWSHLEEETFIIDEKILKPIHSLNPEQKIILQKKLKTTCKLNWSINTWMKFSNDLNEMGQFDNFNGSLLYIIEGLIPLLSAFCYETYLHLSGAYDICKDLLTASSLNIIKELGRKLSMLSSVLTASGHLTNLRQCLENITSLCEALNEEDELSFSNVLFNLKHQVSVKGRTISFTNLMVDTSNPETSLNKDFQDYVARFSAVYNNDEQNAAFSDNSLTIPKGPSFKKLIQLFTDSNDDIKNGQNLKIKKLVLILNTLIQKHNRQGIHSMERSDLEKITLLTLQLICGIIFNKITQVPRGILPPEEFQMQYEEIIYPIQKILLDEGIVEMLISLLHYPKDDIAFQVLACLNVLLYPGNEEAQKRISSLINRQNHELFVRVHQILRGAQTNINREKMGKALAQIAALMSDQTDTSLSVKLMARNKSLVLNSIGSFSESMTDLTRPLSPSESLPQLGGRRRTAAIDDDNEEGFGILSSPVRTSLGISKKPGISPVPSEYFDHRITMALNVLSWLCDGQQKEIQDILREEKMFSGTNIVGQVSFLLHGITEHLNKGNINVSQGAVQALIEMCAGNYSNQLIAFKGQVIMSVNVILQEYLTDENSVEPLRKLKSSSIELIEVMLEETDENSNLLAHWIIRHLDMTGLFNAMLELWQAYSEVFATESNRERWRNSVFRSYHVLKRIADHKEVAVDQLVDYDKYSTTTKFSSFFGDNIEDAKRMWQYCQLWSRSVEVVYKAKSGMDILTQAYFPYDPHKHLNELEKDTILLRVKRNTPQEKLSDLLQWTQAIRSAHAWKKKVKSSRLTYWLLWASTIRHFILFLLTIFLNLLVLFGLESPPASNNNNALTGSNANGSCSLNDSTVECNASSTLLYFQPVIYFEPPLWYRIVIWIVGGIHLILAIWMVLQYYAKHWCNLRFEIAFFKKFIYNAKKGLLRRKGIYQFLQYINKWFCCGKFHATRPQPEKYFQIFFFSFEPLYRLFFVLFSFLAVISNGYFYCGCTLYLFLRNQVLLYVLRAVRKSALQLITVFVLGFVISYMYAVFSFAILPNYFNPENDQFCQTVFQCFITITRLGFLDTLGTGIPIRPSDAYAPNFTVVGFRTVYDLIFFIVVTTLGLNIVVAILVDRFSDLREERDKIDDDNESRCFICSIKKDVFERHGKDYQKHWQSDHNVWSYVDFILYLDTLHPNDRNALEKFVSQKVPSAENPAGSIDFFPIFKAKVLPGFDIEKENND
jgi:inositol 1,4,5-triphosphate receptor type 1